MVVERKLHLRQVRAPQLYRCKEGIAASRVNLLYLVAWVIVGHVDVMIT